MEILLTAAYTFFFLFVIRKWSFFKINELPNTWLSGLFLLKLFAGIILTLIYTYYYKDRATADIYKYFDDSLIIYNAAFTNFEDFLRMMTGIGNDNSYFDIHYYSKMHHWLRPFGSNYYNDTHLLIRFNAFVRFLSLGNFYVHNVFINFLSFTGLIAIYKTFRSIKGINRSILLLGIFLMPSILFWGSGVLKEGFILTVLGFTFYSVKHLQERKKIAIFSFVLLCSLYLLIRLKFYVFLALIPGLAAFVAVKIFKPRAVWLWHLLIFTFMVTLAFNLHLIHNKLNLVQIIVDKQHEFIRLAEYMNSGSQIVLQSLTYSSLSIIKAVPAGLANSFLRPYPWEINGWFLFMSFAENLLLLALIIYCVLKSDLKKANHNLLFLCLSFVILLYALIGITTPVLGALVRYKVPGMLALILISALLANKNKLDIFVLTSNKKNEK